MFWVAKAKLAMLMTPRGMSVSFTNEGGVNQFALYRDCELHALIMHMRAELRGMQSTFSEWDEDFLPHVSWLNVDGTRRNADDTRR
jgi:hypothetical protein